MNGSAEHLLQSMKTFQTILETSVRTLITGKREKQEDGRKHKEKEKTDADEKAGAMEQSLRKAEVRRRLER